ncbi:hypothetical protein [Aminobacter carboxidus]|uniref:Uncharacterized protein n=1 Tax=Aminobacter carboxidus TaxID=376165 RepID=A0ABR9GQU8_9HYPH|nr:hypothetical protein [Aminobacter carboxidus]MBE1205939.1 hypothetical protein [Aminobacter carboxidus]
MSNSNVVIAVVLALSASPSVAQEQSGSQPEQTLESAEPQLGPDHTYIDVVIVEFETLSGPTKQDVEDIIEQTDADDLHDLQNTISQSRQAIMTLAAVGMNPTQVVAAGVTPDGVLTLVVQQTA